VERNPRCQALFAGKAERREEEGAFAQTRLQTEAKRSILRAKELVLVQEKAQTSDTYVPANDDENWVFWEH
jgi:hypothetical protein